MAIFKGYQSNTSKPQTWTLTINDTLPTYFYCTAKGSCVVNHMVGVINPNSTYTLDAQVAAIDSNTKMLKPGQQLPPEGSDDEKSGIPNGAIAGIVVGAVALLSLVAAWFWYRRRQRRRRQAPPTPLPPASFGMEEPRPYSTASYSSPPQYSAENKAGTNTHNFYDLDRHGSPELGGYEIPAVHEVEADRMRSSSHR